MKIKSAVFTRSASDLATCPKSALPEFALIGRSNVGKSSLINLLTEKSALAKVSVTPGKTKLINFFAINGTWHLVDLPGYGYAKVAKKERDEFNQTTSEYLEKRRNIFGIYVLIDSRLPPQAIDLQFLDWLGTLSIPFSILFTKTDRPSAAELRENVAVFKKALSERWDPLPEIILTSSKTRAGRSEVLASIEKVLSAHNRA